MQAILDPDIEGSPVDVVNAAGACSIVLACEHASNRIPRSLNNLGLTVSALSSHIAWDPGAAAVARLMAARLDAALVLARFSRLVIDCNRSPDASASILDVSDGCVIPGNTGLSCASRAARTKAFHAPFHARLGDLLASRHDAGDPPILVTIHSFTPVLAGKTRDVDIGVLHDSDDRLADAVLRLAHTRFDLNVRRNAPYTPQDGVTHTLRRHALPHQYLNVMFEVRNTLVSDDAGQTSMAAGLSEVLLDALAILGSDVNGATNRANQCQN